MKKKLVKIIDNLLTVSTAINNEIVELSQYPDFQENEHFNYLIQKRFDLIYNTVEEITGLLYKESI